MNNDSQNYLIKAQESLRGAESELFARRFNNVANRAYYAAFQAALAALLDASVRVQNDRGGTISHQAVQSKFAGILISRRKLYSGNLARVLSDLLRVRILADYRPNRLSKVRATRALGKARSFVSAVEKRLQFEEDKR